MPAQIIKSKFGTSICRDLPVDVSSRTRTTKTKTISAVNERKMLLDRSKKADAALIL